MIAPKKLFLPLPACVIFPRIHNRAQIRYGHDRAALIGATVRILDPNWKFKPAGWRLPRPQR